MSVCLKICIHMSCFHIVMIIRHFVLVVRYGEKYLNSFCCWNTFMSQGFGLEIVFICMTFLVQFSLLASSYHPFCPSGANTGTIEKHCQYQRCRAWFE